MDHQNIASGRGRDSIRLESKVTYTRGLFIMDLDHMPTGCGTWPAWWTCGANWPNHGEIDIIENINTATLNLQTLHTSSNCSQSGATDQMSGSWMNTNCDVYATGNAGCSVQGGGGSYGAPFNDGKGGVYAMEWTNEFIRVFFFSRAWIPSDIYSAHPNPSFWGRPVGFWQLGSNCAPEHFTEHQIIFDNTFCGDWGRTGFASSCPQYAYQSCEQFVQNNPGAFTEAYWSVNFVKVFQQ